MIKERQTDGENSRDRLLNKRTVYISSLQVGKVGNSMDGICVERLLHNTLR